MAWLGMPFALLCLFPLISAVLSMITLCAEYMVTALEDVFILSGCFQNQNSKSRVQDFVYKKTIKYNMLLRWCVCCLMFLWETDLLRAMDLNVEMNHDAGNQSMYALRCMLCVLQSKLQLVRNRYAKGGYCTGCICCADQFHPICHAGNRKEKQALCGPGRPGRASCQLCHICATSDMLPKFYCSLGKKYGEPGLQPGAGHLWFAAI